MSKNTIILIVLLCIVAVGVGYGKYVVAPKYVAELNKNVPSPVVTPLPMGDAIQSKKTLPELADSLSTKQKIMMLLAPSVITPVATGSASTALVVENLPGVVTLVGVTSTASAQKSAIILNRAVATQSAQFPIFAFSKTGTKPELCSYDPACLKKLESLSKPITISEPLAISASASADLGEDAVLKFKKGATVLSLSSKIKQVQLSSLVDQLVIDYSTDLTFKQLVDANVLQVLSLQEEYK